MAKRKKKRGSTIKFVDPKGKRNATYKVKRDTKGHYKGLKQIAGLNVCEIHEAGKAKPRYTKNGRKMSHAAFMKLAMTHDLKRKHSRSYPTFQIVTYTAHKNG